MMTCEFVSENIGAIVSGDLGASVRADCDRHIATCADCADALRGAEALAALSARKVESAPEGLLSDLLDESLGVPAAPRRTSGFWLGAGFGGAIAASILVAALAMGWIAPAVETDSGAAQFTVALREPRNVEVAIETDRVLANASISIVVSGGVAIEGYGDRRQLSWTTDLEAGVNRLSIPITAINELGGQMVVRLDHPESEQQFLVNLNTGA